MGYLQILNGFNLGPTSEKQVCTVVTILTINKQRYEFRLLLLRQAKSTSSFQNNLPLAQI